MVHNSCHRHYHLFIPCSCPLFLTHLITDSQHLLECYYLLSPLPPESFTHLKLRQHNHRMMVGMVMGRQSNVSIKNPFVAQKPNYCSLIHARKQQHKRRSAAVFASWESILLNKRDGSQWDEIKFYVSWDNVKTLPKRCCRHGTAMVDVVEKKPTTDGASVSKKAKERLNVIKILWLFPVLTQFNCLKSWGKCESKGALIKC